MESHGLLRIPTLHFLLQNVWGLDLENEMRSPLPASKSSYEDLVAACAEASEPGSKQVLVTHHVRRVPGLREAFVPAVLSAVLIPSLKGQRGPPSYPN